MMKFPLHEDMDFFAAQICDDAIGKLILRKNCALMERPL